MIAEGNAPELRVEESTGREWHEEIAFRMDEAVAGNDDSPLLVRRGDGPHLLVLAMSAALSDAGSATMFCRALADTYGDVESEEEALQYADFVAWQEELLAEEEEEAEAARTHWRTFSQALPRAALSAQSTDVRSSPK